MTTTMTGMRFGSWVRWVFGAVVLVGAAWGLSGCAAPTALVVTTHDAAPGDGVCDDGAGRCSLRAASEEASAGSAAVEVTVPVGTYTLGSGPLVWQTGSRPVSVRGLAPGAVIDAAGASAGLVVGSGSVSVSVVGLAVKGAAGPGVQVQAGATVRLVAVSLHHDSAGVEIGVGATVVAVATTVSDNTGVGVVNSGGSLDATSVTVTANGSGGITGWGPVRLTSSVVAAQVAGPNCRQVTTTSGGYNLDSDRTCFSPGGSDLVGSPNAKLAPLSADRLAAHTPMPGSAAIDSVPAGSCGAGIDQLGQARPVGVACDRGAVEAVFAPRTFVVNTSFDGNDVNPGDGVCAEPFGLCTLRAAVTEANLRPTAGTHTIVLGASPRLSIAPAGDNDNTSGDLDVAGNITITGSLKTIDAGTIDRVFHQHGGHLTLTSASVLTVQGGLVSGPAAAGGAILTDGELTLDRVNVGLNRTSGTDSSGGAIAGTPTASITINRSVLQLNHADGWQNDQSRGGAIAATGGSLSITDSSLVNNGLGDFTSYGGAVSATDTSVTITRSAITGNRATVGGGAVWVSGGTTSVTDTTIAANRVGAQLYSPGKAPIGEAIFAAGPVVLRYVTVVAAPPSGYPRATIAGASHVTLAASVVEPGESRACDMPTSSSGGYNLVGDRTCHLGGPGDAEAQNPVLGALGDHGGPSTAPLGPTATVLAAAGSPVLDAIPVGTPGLCDATTSADQRGFARPASGACDRGAAEGSGPTLDPLSLTVTSPIDAVDAGPGDGVCDDGAGRCTLRAAVMETNARPTTDTVTIAPGVHPVVTRTGNVDDDLTGDIDVNDWLDVHGNDATVSLELRDNGFDAHGRGFLLDHVRVVRALGSGVRASAGQVTVRNSLLFGALGSGLTSEGTSVTVDATTIAGNVGTVRGPGLDVRFGDLLVRNSTVSGNTYFSDSRGATGVSTYQSNTTLHAVTIAGNALGPSLFSDIPMRLEASVVVPAPGRFACDGPVTVTSGGYNVVADASCALGGPGDRQTVNAMLGSLAGNGGPTATHLPFAGSPAIDVIPVGTVGLCDVGTPVDQRAVPRPAGSGCDAGAVEGSGPPLPPLDLLVDSSADSVDVTPNDGVCADSLGRCTLRAAIIETNARPTTDTISIAPGIDPVLTIAGGNDDAAASGDLDITSWLVLHGGGAVVDANGLDRVLDISGATQADVDHLTVTGGVQTEGPGIRSRANLVLDSVTVTGNTYSGSGALEAGSAVLVAGASTSITNSMVTGNRSAVVGAAVGESCRENGYSRWCQLRISDSTIAGNEGDGVRIVAGATIERTHVSGNTGLGVSGQNLAGSRIDGSTIDGNGGVGLVLGSSSVTVSNTTITGNGGATAVDITYGAVGLRASTVSGPVTAVTVAAPPFSGSSLVVAATVLDGAPGSTCVGGPFTSGGYNVVSDASCAGATAVTDQTSSPVLLGPLADNGGPTPTRLPYAAFVGLDAIPTGTVGLCDASSPVDQRGVGRPQGPACDVGAVEGVGGPGPGLTPQRVPASTSEPVPGSGSETVPGTAPASAPGAGTVGASDR